MKIMVDVLSFIQSMYFLLGNPRIQMFTILYKDKRCKILIRFSILEKMYLCRFIKPDEVNQIESMLLPHQKAKIKYSNIYSHNYIHYIFEYMLDIYIFHRYNSID